MNNRVLAGLLAATGVALLAGCGSAAASEEEVAVVCGAMSQAAGYGGMIDGVTVARNVLVESYDRDPSEVFELIDSTVRAECPEFRGQL